MFPGRCLPSAAYDLVIACLEIARALMRFDHVVRVIVNANYGVM